MNDHDWYTRKKEEPDYVEIRRMQSRRYNFRIKLGKSLSTDYYLFALDALELAHGEPKV